MQHVNFYQDEFQFHLNWRLVGIVGSVVFVLLIFAGYNISQVFTANQLSAELSTKQNLLKNLEQTYSSLEVAAKPRARDMNLLASLERLKRDNTEKLRALNYLSGNDAGNTTGFSFLMEGLGRKRDNIDDLWLKNITFSRGGYDMRLAGSSYQADLLPKFIKILSNEEIYKDREFKNIKLSRSDKNSKVIDFIVDTQYQVEEKNPESGEASMAMFMARLKQMSASKEPAQ